MSNKRKNNNEQHPIDKVFRDGLHDRPFEFDEKYWENAQSTLNNLNQQNKGNNNRFRFWIILGAVIGLSLLSIFLIFPKNNNQSEQSTTAQQQHPLNQSENNTSEELNPKQIETPKSSQNSENNFGEKSNAQLADNQSFTKGNSSKSAPEAINSGTSNSSKTAPEDLAAVGNTNNKTGNSNAASKTTSGNTATSNTNNKNQNSLPEHVEPKKNNDALNNTKNEVTNNNNEQTNNGTNPDNNPGLRSNINDSNANQTNTNNSPDLKTNINDNNADQTSGNNPEINTDPEQNNSNQTTQSGTNTTGNQENNSNDTKTQNSDANGNGTKTNAPAPTKPKKSFNPSISWYAEAGAGMAFSNGSLTAVNPDYNDWINLRNTQETTEPTFDYFAHAGIVLNNFSINSGINSYAYRQTATYTFTGYEFDTTVTYIIDDSSGLIVDSIIEITVDTIVSSSTNTNNLRYVEIPFLVGYQFTAGNWQLGIQTGPSLSMLSSASVVYPTLDASDTETIGITYFRKTTFNWIAKPSVYYFVTPNFGIGLNGNFRWNLNSLVETTDFEQKQMGYGLQLGIKVKF
jgi:hypothetical protein